MLLLLVLPGAIAITSNHSHQNYRSRHCTYLCLCNRLDESSGYLLIGDGLLVPCVFEYCRKTGRNFSTILTAERYELFIILFVQSQTLPLSASTRVN